MKEKIKTIKKNSIMKKKIGNIKTHREMGKGCSSFGERNPFP